MSTTAAIIRKEPVLPAPDRTGERGAGVLLVAASAIAWSFGGTIARAIGVADSWTVVFWRSVFSALFLLVFMLLRDRPRGTLALFREMGLAGLAVALCFATASTAFVVALAHTTVANILLIQAGVPLIAALMAWALFRERVSPATWLAIGAVILGVAVMVSDTFSGKVSPTGDGLALLITISFATATVITRRRAEIRMTPAVCLGTAMAAALSAVLAGGYAVAPVDFALLFAFGALNLGMGLAFFVTGARLIPAALAALIGTLEPVLGPVWVWLMHGEVPSDRTVVGGVIVLAALVVHLLLEARRQARGSARRGTMPLPPAS